MSDMSNDLIKTIDRIAADACDRPTRVAAEAGQWPTALWNALDEVGLVRGALPEAAGGSGLDFDDAMLALRRTAYHAMPVPLAETMLAGRLLVAAGLDVPEGPLTIAPVRAEQKLVASGTGAGATVSGTARRVPWGDACPYAVVVADAPGSPVMGLVAIEGLLVSVDKNLAGEPRAQLQFDRAPLIAVAPLADAWQRLATEGALCRSVQMIGALERTLEYGLLYANDRVQFGKPIGKFQAVQHMLAILAGHVAASSAVVDAAVEASTEQADEFAVAVAKSRVGEAAGKCAEIAHQVHGAMGYTHEHNLHYSTRRLWAWRDEFGGESHWQVRLGRMVSAKGPDALWPTLVGERA
ncbi:MAG: acyl-CoA dehydrogenase [Comamonadaceae bacterium]|nr:MAG: acyl-CoA dehydrogenase [Comamonadaceae bacterium]